MSSVVSTLLKARAGFPARMTPLTRLSGLSIQPLRPTIIGRSYVDWSNPDLREQIIGSAWNKFQTQEKAEHKKRKMAAKNYEINRNLCDAIKDGSLEKVNKVLEDNKDYLKSEDSKSLKTTNEYFDVGFDVGLPFLYTIQKGNIEVAKALLKAGFQLPELERNADRRNSLERDATIEDMCIKYSKNPAQTERVLGFLKLVEKELKETQAQKCPLIDSHTKWQDIVKAEAINGGIIKR